MSLPINSKITPNSPTTAGSTAPKETRSLGAKLLSIFRGFLQTIQVYRIKSLDNQIAKLKKSKPNSPKLKKLNYKLDQILKSIGVPL